MVYLGGIILWQSNRSSGAHESKQSEKVSSIDLHFDFQNSQVGMILYSIFVNLYSLLLSARSSAIQTLCSCRSSDTHFLRWLFRGALPTFCFEGVRSLRFSRVGKRLTAPRNRLNFKESSWCLYTKDGYADLIHVNFAVPVCRQLSHRSRGTFSSRASPPRSQKDATAR